MTRILSALRYPGPYLCPSYAELAVTAGLVVAMVWVCVL